METKDWIPPAVTQSCSFPFLTVALIPHTGPVIPSIGFLGGKPGWVQPYQGSSIPGLKSLCPARLLSPKPMEDLPSATERGFGVAYQVYPEQHLQTGYPSPSLGCLHCRCRASPTACCVPYKRECSICADLPALQCALFSLAQVPAILVIC